MDFCHAEVVGSVVSNLSFVDVQNVCTVICESQIQERSGIGSGEAV